MEASEAAPQENQEQAPDLAEQVNVIAQRLDRAGIGDEEEAAEPSDDDLFDSLYAGAYGDDDEDEGEQYEYVEEPGEPEQVEEVEDDLYEGPVYQDPYGNPVDAYGQPLEEVDEDTYDEEEIEELVASRVADAVQPVVQAMEDARRADDLDRFANLHPDVNDKVDDIADRLAPMADQYGEGILTDPRMVAQTYFALKAEEAAASGKPLEIAASEGASLETNAGAGFGVQGTEDDDIKKRLLAAGGKDPVAG